VFFVLEQIRWVTDAGSSVGTPVLQAKSSSRVYTAAAAAAGREAGWAAVKHGRVELNFINGNSAWVVEMKNDGEIQSNGVIQM